LILAYKREEITYRNESNETFGIYDLRAAARSYYI